MAVIFSCMAVFALIIFFAIRNNDALFAALFSASGAACLFAIRAKVWDKKKIIELEPNAYFWIAILFLVILECVCFYLFNYSNGINFLSKITFFAKYGKYFVWLIPIWIITLYNFKK